ncbi:Cell surface protein [Bacillus cereus]|nr:Cell surface protein [Bacillus cereus]
MKKIVGIIVSTVICVPFLMANVVTATSANSKAGITFSNSYTPNTSTDPTKINTKKETVDKNKNGDKYLPKNRRPDTGIQTIYRIVFDCFISICIQKN